MTCKKSFETGSIVCKHHIDDILLIQEIMPNKVNSSTILMDIGQGLSMMLGLPRIDSWDTSGRPKRAKTGTFGFNSQTNSLEYFDGNEWFSARLRK